MIKEIMGIPESLRFTFNEVKLSDFCMPANIEHVLFVSCGTSYHSSLIGQKYIEIISKIPTESIIASEF